MKPKYKWVGLDGVTRNKCPNRNFMTSEHMVSDDGKRCLCCGAVKTEAKPPVKDKK